MPTGEQPPSELYVFQASSTTTKLKLRAAALVPSCSLLFDESLSRKSILVIFYATVARACTAF